MHNLGSQKSLGPRARTYAQTWQASVHAVLGDHIYSYLLKEKKAEWEEYCSIVTDWEVQKCYVGI